VLSQQEEEQQE